MRVDGRLYDGWQVIDFYMIIFYRKVCLNRARGGSKTADIADICVFLALRNNSVFWVAASNSQLIRCKKYWSENSFVIRFNYTSFNIRFCRLSNFNFIEFCCATEGNIRGPRANVLIFDELAMIKRALYENTLPIANGMSKISDGIFHIMISTPILGSIFQDLCNKYKTITRDWRWMSWFDLKEVADAKSIMNNAKFSQEFLCKFTALEGVIFENNIFQKECPYELYDKILYGFDPNPRSGYVIVGIQFCKSKKALQIAFCHNFGSNEEGKLAAFRFIQNNLIGQRSIEIELNGVGYPIYDQFVFENKQLAGKVLGIKWEDVDKVDIVNHLSQYEIYIPNRGKEWLDLFDQVSNLSWTKDGNRVDKPKDVEWHYADSFLHADHEINYAGIVGALSA